MKKYFLLLLIVCVLFIAGCDTQASRVSYNISQQADNFNIVRKLTVINCIQGDVLFQMVGRLSIYSDNMDEQLEVTVENNGGYQKHFIGLSDNVTYVVEDLCVSDVSKYQYTLNYNPKMWIPVDLGYID